MTVRESGDLDTDKAAVEDLIRQYRKEQGSTRVVVGRGLDRGDVAILDLLCRPAGAAPGTPPLPGLDKRKLTFDTEADPLGAWTWQVFAAVRCSPGFLPARRGASCVGCI